MIADLKKNQEKSNKPVSPTYNKAGQLTKNHKETEQKVYEGRKVKE